MNLFEHAEIQRQQGIIQRQWDMIRAMALVWQPEQLFEGGVTVLIEDTLYRAIKPSWNVYPKTRIGPEFWTEIGKLEEE